MLIIGMFYLYHFLIFMLSLGIGRRHHNEKDFQEPERQLAIIIPAHNEENVIFDSVSSVRGSDYPPELFDVIVIADNCTDGTVLRAEEAGAHVLVRSNKILRGKQHALKWAFEEIDLDYYDAVVVLDADNHVHPDYLLALNSRLVDGHRVIQGYVETKNPNDSWVAANYAFMFWYICRLQMARTLLGLSAWLAGTGLCISVEVLRRVGWNVETLVDDVEYTCALILAGERVVFADDAIIYDLKPLGLADSMRQRLRWIRGQMQTCVKYVPQFIASIPRLWWRGETGQLARSVDALMWIPMHIIIVVSVIMSIYQGWWQYLLSLAITAPAFHALPMVAEKIKRSRAWTYLITAGAFFLTWMPITIYGVITCGNKVWWKTPH